MTWPLPCAEGSLRASCRPTPPTRPSTTLSNPQGASLCGPVASSNSSYVPCYQLLCESRLSTPARHIRSYPFWITPVFMGISHSGQPWASVWHNYAMIACRMESPCYLRIDIGQNCLKTQQISYSQSKKASSSLERLLCHAPTGEASPVRCWGRTRRNTQCKTPPRQWGSLGRC
jgi:hypothetical protein